MAKDEKKANWRYANYQERRKKEYDIANYAVM